MEDFRDLMSAQLGGFQPGGGLRNFRDFAKVRENEGFSTFQQTRNHHQRVPNSTANSAQPPNNCPTAILTLLHQLSTASSSIRPSTPVHKPSLTSCSSGDSFFTIFIPFRERMRFSVSRWKRPQPQTTKTTREESGESVGERERRGGSRRRDSDRNEIDISSTTHTQYRCSPTTNSCHRSRAFLKEILYECNQNTWLVQRSLLDGDSQCFRHRAKGYLKRGVLREHPVRATDTNQRTTQEELEKRRHDCAQHIVQ